MYCWGSTLLILLFVVVVRAQCVVINTRFYLARVRSDLRPDCAEYVTVVRTRSIDQCCQPGGRERF